MDKKSKVNKKKQSNAKNLPSSTPISKQNPDVLTTN
jgi:hypothetical protein